MTKVIRILACAAILGTAILMGCNKNGLDDNKGKAIRFSAVSKGALATKTAYGADNTNHTFQVIDWQANDLIRVYSTEAVHRNDGSQHFADYIILGSTVDAENHTSTASLKAETLDNTDSDNAAGLANGLIWGSEATYDFWGIYPSTAQNKDITLGASGAVSAVIPAAQPLNGTATDKTVGTVTYKEYKPDMNYAYMTAAAIGMENGKDFNLVFNPAFTAFEFNVTSEDETPVELTGFELLSPDGSDKLAGSFTMTAGDLTSVAAPSGTSSVTVDMSSSHQTVTDETGLTFTVFTLPADNAKPLRLRFSSTNGTQAKTSRLDLVDKNGKALVFTAGTKYRINMLKLPSSQWKISIAPVLEPWVLAEEDEVIIYI
jgi:hypothetical protein